MKPLSHGLVDTLINLPVNLIFSSSLDPIYTLADLQSFPPSVTRLQPPIPLNRPSTPAIQDSPRIFPAISSLDLHNTPLLSSTDARQSLLFGYVMASNPRTYAVGNVYFLSKQHLLCATLVDSHPDPVDSWSHTLINATVPHHYPTPFPMMLYPPLKCKANVGLRNAEKHHRGNKTRELEYEARTKGKGREKKKVSITSQKKRRPSFLRERTATHSSHF